MWIEISKVVGSFSKGDVTPLAGVWIEISCFFVPVFADIVTPLAGVWIEILIIPLDRLECRSLPLRECGLKSISLSSGLQGVTVTPLAGVWIEIDS